jgi:hypothetical protein
MKKKLLIVGLIIVSLAALLPFISRTPDGVQQLTADSGAAQTQQPSWNGIMSNYMVAAVGDPYVSTLMAGAFGTVIVLATTFVLGSMVAPKKKNGTVRKTQSP